MQWEVGKECTSSLAEPQGRAHTRPSCSLHLWACHSIVDKAHCSELFLINAEEWPTAFPGVLVTGPEQESHPYLEWVLKDQL